MTRGRRALVTGASSGIGAAAARLLAEAGYRVALIARKQEKLEALRAQLEAPQEHLALAFDLTDPESIAAAYAEVGSAFGGLDLLVNNAGMGYRARVEELEADLLARLFETNVTGLLLSCREALPLLRRGERPVVVNVASVVGRRGIPGQVAYAASKAAVCSISEGLRIEWASEDIAVCNLSPALTATGFFEAQPNPSKLPGPDLASAAGPAQVARHILALDEHPRPELSLRKKWHFLSALAFFAPRLADRLLVSRLGGGWQLPRR